jgi:NAD-dependent histone deacetylase SIR2
MSGVPRVLINLDRVGGLGSRPDDVCILSECDEGVRNLADALGWRDELEALWKEVSGKDTREDAVEAPPDTRTMDEKLEDEIASLTREVDQTLKISNGHKEYLEEHLNRKIAKGPSETSTRSLPRDTEDRTEIGGKAAIADDDTQINLERVDVPRRGETEGMKSMDEPSILTPTKIVPEKNPTGAEESTTESEALLESSQRNPPIIKMDDPGTSNGADDTKSHL